ncbi:hypothetical protein BPA30113_03948 [Burkholderia paludis]|uniref:Uncharacterized protein n=1 Tax=Burkholderia paludis TaxID=1506587 RepID=A0A6J5F6A1_9BURK|nr:hypothetical protein LMG30113_07049 [Burkholderia paludis]VWB85449.1 hypothetical protein BPA30113_03948 [Burkholderia paludis]
MRRDPIPIGRSAMTGSGRVAVGLVRQPVANGSPACGDVVACAMLQVR